MDGGILVGIQLPGRSRDIDVDPDDVLAVLRRVLPELAVEGRTGRDVLPRASGS